jgi:hypothetical protein
MTPKEPRDKQRTGKTGLFLVSDRTPQREWESFPRSEPKPAYERLGQHDQSQEAA